MKQIWDAYIEKDFKEVKLLLDNFNYNFNIKEIQQVFVMSCYNSADSNQFDLFKIMLPYCNNIKILKGLILFANIYKKTELKKILTIHLRKLK